MMVAGEALVEQVNWSGVMAELACELVDEEEGRRLMVKLLQKLVARHHEMMVEAVQRKVQEESWD